MLIEARWDQTWRQFDMNLLQKYIKDYGLPDEMHGICPENGVVEVNLHD